MKLLFLSAIILCFSGCSSRTTKKVFKEHQSDMHGVDKHEMMARCTMLPDQMQGYDVVDVSCDQRVRGDELSKVKITYAPHKGVVVNISDVINYYKASMEMLGWRFVSDFCTDHDQWLLFKKPNNIHCQIVINHQGLMQVLLL